MISKIDFSDSRFYDPLFLISKEVEAQPAEAKAAFGAAPVIALEAITGHHTIYCSSEWRNLCQSTFYLCNGDKRRFIKSWEPIQQYLRTKPRYFEPCSGSRFLAALAQSWIDVNCKVRDRS